MGSRSQMLLPSVAARHSRLTHDHTRRLHVGKVQLVFKLVFKVQPEPTSTPGEEVCGNVIVKVDSGLQRSCIQHLQQKNVSVMVRLCNVHDNSFDIHREGCGGAKLTSFTDVGLSGLWWFAGKLWVYRVS
ncbi:TPA: hypothetical protein ACH3X2_012777 [Trebouxia sp. C0005]